ncbi:BspA family leucine-rich repeat surface protein [uncultured Aquimarina sp.]|uniref:BspA family leucine-rich repeat surface protein n=1 Tax=uncultured Aquimarina sp. TaxID=575652 RepID=UPI0026041913|nr:BspA family leucine-rich repeat surface protein [uncultured Aquimarina sp.]
MKHVYLTLFFIVSFLSFSSAQDEFIFRVQTTSVNETFTIPTFSGETYLYNVLWVEADNSISLSSNITGDTTYTFKSSGIHTVYISSVPSNVLASFFPRVYFNNSGDKNKIISIEQWGNNQWTSMENAFSGCLNLEINATDSPDLSQTTSLENMFRDCIAVDFSLANWNVSTITNMSGMFDGVKLSTTHYDNTLNNWVTQNLRSDVIFDAGYSTYCSAFLSRRFLTDPIEFNWTITDDGEVCEEDIFITDWQTTSSNESITIPTTGSGYNYTVDWGDGVLTFGNTGNATHNYTNAGTYEIKIYGDFPRIHFNNTGDKDKIIAVNQWGSIDWVDMTNAFYGCSNLVINATDAPNLSNVSNLNNMFNGAINFQDNGGAIGNWDISNITTMQDMFAGVKISSNQYNAILDGWVTASAGETIPTNIDVNFSTSVYTGNTDSWNMLKDTHSWSIQDYTDAFITTWRTNAPNEDIRLIVAGTGILYDVDWGDGTTSTGLTGIADHTYASAETYTVVMRGVYPHFVINNNTISRDKILSVEQWGNQPWSSLERSFWGCSNLVINATDTPNLSNVTSLDWMFYDATSMVDNCGAIGTWDTSNIQQMERMFRGATSFNSDISTWDVSNVQTFQAAFRDATSFDQNLGDWDISSATSMGSMFSNIGLSQDNYDATLIGWATLDAGETIPSNININFGSSQYCAGAFAKNTLKTDYTWTFTDGGLACDETDKFITTWQTTTNNESITIPTTGTGYDYTVEWGDGTSSDNNTGNETHTYATAGTYQIKIYGSFPRIYFPTSGMHRKIQSVDQWGSITWNSMDGAFVNCINLDVLATDAPDLSNITSLWEMFLFCESLGTSSSLDFSGWDTSTITSMRTMFFGTSKFNSATIANWDVSNVTNFQNMFEAATIFDQDLGAWDISKATNMGNMFRDNRMSFSNYESTLQGWATLDTGEVQIPTNINLGAQGVSYCDKTYREQLKNDYTWSFTGDIFNCPENDKFITTWQVAAGDLSITIPTTGSGYNYKVEWGDGLSNEDIIGNATHTYATPGVKTIKIFGDFPRIYINNSGDKDKIVSIEQWGTQQWTSMVQAFRGCANLVINASDTPDLSLVTDMTSIFEGTTNLEDLKDNIGNWNVSTIENMTAVFKFSGFNENVNNWNVSNVRFMDSMFEEAFEFNQPLNNWITDKLEFSNAVFKRASKFNQDISNWNMSLVQETGQMFLAAIDFDQSLASWDISSMINMNGFFLDTQISTANYDTTLIGWATLTTGESAIPQNIVFTAGSSRYCFGEQARNTLTSAPYNWDITDNGASCSATDSFITTLRTTTANQGITIPTTGSGYNYDIDWGDGAAEYGVTGNATHVYVTSGVYRVKITGDFPRIYFNNTGDKDVITSIDQWGTQQWNSMEGAFYGCTALELNVSDAPDLTQVTSLERMFMGTNNIVDNEASMNSWNTSTITNMANMFADSIFDFNITSWDVGKVENFVGMFNNNAQFNQNIGGWNVGENVVGTINMQAMFDSTSSFNSPLNTWDTSKVTNMVSMFGFATAFNQPLDAWDTSTIENMGGMFFGASDFDQNVGGWNLSNVTNMGAMFQQSGLSTENYDATLIGWATQDVGETIPSNISISFEGSQYCFGAEARNTLIDDSGLNWSISDDGLACASTDFFITTWQTTAANESITIPTTGSGYDYNINWGDGTIEFGNTGNASHSYTTAGIYTIKILGDFPQFASLAGGISNAEKLRTVQQWGNIEWRSMLQAFSRCSNMNITAIDIPNLSNVTAMDQMFFGCSNLQSPDFSNWDTSSVTTMTWMFINARSFNGNISTWDVGNVTAFDLMLAGASSFNQDVSSWNIGEHVTGTITMSSMFENAIAFNQNLGTWDISKVTDMNLMLKDSGLSVANYDATLMGWASNANTPNGLVLGADGLKYCVGEASRDILTSVPYNWTIDDAGLDCNDAFITTWETTIDDESITVPTTGSGYNYVVDWGDGTAEFGLKGNATHEYATAGAHTVRIIGDFPRFYNPGLGGYFTNAAKIQSIEQWGTQQWTSMESAFDSATNLVINATDVPDLSAVTHMGGMFFLNSSLADNGGTIGTWDVSNVQNMSYLFANTPLNKDISSWNTGKVIDMSGMFFNTANFDQNLEGWDISNVTNMQSMFNNSRLSTTNYDATLVGWATDISGVAGDGMDDVPIGVTFDAGSSTYCFAEDARNILTNTPYNWTITDGGLSCNFTNAFITSWETTAANESITVPTTGSGYNYSVDWGDGTIEGGFTGNATHEYTTAGTYTVKITGDFPRIFFNNGGNKNKILTIEQWGTIAWESMAQAFNGCANLTLNAIDSPDLSLVTNATRMFANTTNFDDLQNVIGQWNTGSINNMNALFIDSGFNEDIGDWDVSKVTNFSGMFYECPNFDQDLGNWDVSEAVNMRSFITTTSLATSSFSSENYDKTLKGWATLDPGETRIPRDVNVDVDLTRYCDAFVERAQLINDYNWRISDLGLGCPENEKFITTWQVAAGETITIPTLNGQPYQYIVEWGDNTTSVSTNDNPLSHTYINTRTYTIKITGDFPRIFFNGTGDKDKILSIEQWGTQQWLGMQSAFRGCTNLVINATDVPDLSIVQFMDSMFSNTTSFVDNGGEMNNWDITNVISLVSLFEGSVFNENINNWDVSGVQTMGNMFQDNTAFNQSLNLWRPENVSDFEHMFNGATSFNQPVGDWTMTNAAFFESMFEGAAAFDQDLGNWDISTIDRDGMINMFVSSGISQENYDATLIGWATLDVGETQIPVNVQLDADATYCLGITARNTLTTAPYNWTITDGGIGCDFTTAFITTWQTTADNESIIIPTTGSGYNYNVDWGDGIVEVGFTGNATHQYTVAGTYEVKIIGDFPRIYFNNAGDIEKIQSIEHWGTQPWRNFQNAFSGCSQLRITATDAPDLSNVTNLNNMFRSCISLDAPNFSNWDTSSIITMKEMFYRANNFDGNITNWDVGKVTSFELMFYEAFKFNQNISSWNIGEFVSTKIVNMNSMFSTASSFNQPIGSWDLSKVSNIRSMFFRATAFNRPLDSWDVSGMGTLKRLFFSASSFNQPLDSWDVSTISNMDEMFWGASSFNQNLGDWNISEATIMNRLLLITAMSTANYDTTLIGWATLDTGETRIPSNIILDADATYCLGEAARNVLTSAPYNWTITDEGLDVNCDITAPVITLNGANPQIIELGAGYTELGATTDDGTEVTVDASEFMDSVGSYTIYYDATDAAGNSAIQVTRTVNVVDTTAPVITLIGANPQIIELGAGYTELGATTDDGTEVTVDASEFMDVVGSYTIYYDAADAAGNAAAQVTRTVNVVDTTAPVITLIGANPQTIELGAGYTELGATTDDGAEVTVDASEFMDAIGSYTMYYDATDVTGNAAVQVIRTVNVVDTTNPTVVCQNITVPLDDSGNVSITAAMVDNGSSDLSGIASLAIDITDFDCATIGDNVVVLTVTDANGNSDMCMATVTIEDRIAPEFDMATVPTDMNVTFDTGDMYTLADFTSGVVVTDNCDTNRSGFATTITQSPVAGILLGAGDHVITLTATDDNANEQTTTFTITVTDDILSVGENTEEVFTLYPNPAKQRFQVSGFSGEAVLSIYDVNGRSLLTEKVDAGQSISIQELPNGAYFVKIAIGNTYETIRLMKNE